MIDPIAAVGAVDGSALTSIQPLDSTSNLNAGLANFANKIGDSLDHVNADVNAADMQARSLVLGETDNLHGVLIALETARVSMGVMVQVRNRLVDAYQDVMRMQI